MSEANNNDFIESNSRREDTNKGQVTAVLMEFKFPLSFIPDIDPSKISDDADLYEIRDSKEKPEAFAIGEDLWKVIEINTENSNLALKNLSNSGLLIAARIIKLKEEFHPNAYIVHSKELINLNE